MYQYRMLEWKYQYRVLEWKVVDGDTVDLVLDVGFRHTIKDRFRMFGPDPFGKSGINAPEINTLEGQLSAQHLSILLHNACDSPLELPPGHWNAGSNLVAHTVKDRREKFGRWLVTLIAEDPHLIVKGKKYVVGQYIPKPSDEDDVKELAKRAASLIVNDQLIRCPRFNINAKMVESGHAVLKRY